MRHLFSLISFVFIFNCFYAQNNVPSSCISKEFHKERREQFRKFMPDNSVAFIFSDAEKNYSRDVNYVFHQNPDMYYLCGYVEPDAALVIFKETQLKGDTTFNELLFVREKSKIEEMWNGKRLGVQKAKQTLGIKNVYKASAFRTFPINFKAFDRIIYQEIPSHLRNNNTDPDYNYLLQQFINLDIIEKGDVDIHKEKRIIADYFCLDYLEGFVRFYKDQFEKSETLKNEPLVQAILNNPDSAACDSIKSKANEEPLWGLDFYRNIIDSIRMVKTPEEIAIIRKAVNISSVGHTEAMKYVAPKMNEREIEALHLYVHKKYGAESESFPPIIASGSNGCILHYTDNNMAMTENELLIMDVGVEYRGYCSDITRTIPISGRFTNEQKAIYNIVYEAQEEVFKLCAVGTEFQDLENKAKEVIGKGLFELEIIKDSNELAVYLPHTIIHHIGLNVHDVGPYDYLRENMVIAVEPGIYIPENSECDSKWWNIAVRIEDDVLILKDKHEVLSSSAPRNVKEIEATQGTNSKFNEIVLPKL